MIMQIAKAVPKMESKAASRFCRSNRQDCLIYEFMLGILGKFLSLSVC